MKLKDDQGSRDEDCVPVLKHQTSFQHPLSSQPPKIHAVLSIRVALCARIPCPGITPYTGALLQYINVAGASSTSFEKAKCGVERNFG